MEGDNQDHLDKLKRQLYGPLEQLRALRRTDLETDQGPRPSLWKRVEPLETANKVLTFKILKRLLWLTGLLFLLGVAAVLLVFWRGDNSVSADNISFKIAGATESAAGEEVALQLALTNGNDAALELVDLMVEYPAGTRVAGALAQPLIRERLSLGNIRPGETVQRQIRAVLFGEQGSDQEIKFDLEYRLADSSAIFHKRSSYHVFINSTPLTVRLELPEEINSNQEIKLEVVVESNAESRIERPVVVLDYPAGFRFIQAKPVPTTGQNVWQFNTLEPGKKLSLQVTGTLEGQDDEEKAFRASAGTLDREGADELSATYGSVLVPVTIRRPVLALRSSVNGSSASEVITDSVGPLRVELEWSNNALEEIIDGELKVKVAGPALDTSSVDPEKGYYNSNSGTILWTKQQLRDLAKIAPGEGGRVTFDFATLSLVDEGSSLRQPELVVTAEWKGKRITDRGRTEDVFASASQKIKISSVTQFAAKVLRNTGPFENHGPIPPEVGQESTYTIVWSALNSTNNLNGAKVTATLPNYVEWLGFQSPLSEPLDFRPNESGGGEVVWNLGQVLAGVGTTNPAREVAFMVSLTPSLGQVGESPTLILQPVLEAVDSFTKEVLTAKPSRELNTEFLTESQYETRDGRVEN